ncbi:unnamed protein product, partial [Ectocarpus sp. 12 AP-2014]
MVDVAVVLLQVVAEIRDVAKGIEENDRQACRLSKRVLAIEPPVLAVHEGTKMSSSESLRQLLATVEKIRNFLGGYARTSKFNRALKRKANADKFTQLGVILTEGMQALQLDVAVDAWAKEDASDRLADLENMVDMMERMERSRTDNHAEVMGVLKALRNDERAELAGWVEIDYGTDLDFEGSNILGSGGFGEVRTAKWNGADVAVKHLLASGLQRDSVRALRKEIRLHSSLHFDFVAPLYAASTIPPHLCLVVELAGGGSLQQYLHSTSEPLAHALQTAFLYDIARGMSFLHAKGILHRDLKSANVLMFANGRLKLCDFGLSKVKIDLSSRSKQGAVGTTQWMSPEEMDESPANELTDVYSFGVLCFEVATRTEPFKGKRPAQVIGTVLYKAERPQIPEGASASPDVVALMEQCWKQDPADRPDGFRPVVGALADVIRRVGDPRVGIPAPPTVGGSVDASSSWSDPASQPAGVDTGSSPDKSKGSAFAESGSGRDGFALEGAIARRAAEDTVVPGAGKMYAPFADLPVESKGLPPSSGASSGRFKKLRNMFGQKLSMKDKNEKEGRLREPAMAVGGTMSDSDDLKIAIDLRNRADRLREQGNYAEAAPLYLRAIEIQEKILGPDHQDLATTLNNRAGLLESQGKFAEAEPLYRRATEILETALGPEHPNVATALNNRALLLKKQGRYTEAEPLYERSQAIREKMLGPEHPDVAESLNNRARLLKAQGKYEDADPLYQRAAAINEAVLGPDHPRVATDLNNRAWLLSAQGKYDEADPLYLRAIEIGETTLGPDHPDLATRLNNRARLLESQGKYDEADPLYQRALAIDEKVLGPDHPNVATNLNNRALLLKAQEKYTEAIPLLERALSIRTKKLGENHPDTVSSQNNLKIVRKK